MDDAAGDLELLLSTTRETIDGLRKDPRLAPRKGKGKRGAALLGHLDDLMAASEHRMSRVPDKNAPEKTRQAFSRTLRESIALLRAAHGALPWVTSTDTPSVNLGSLYMTEECARFLVTPDVDLTVVPDAEFMYSTTSWPFAAVIDGTPGYTAQTTRRPIVLNYPLSDGDRLLLHPLFAHELGHASADEYDSVKTIEGELDNDREFTAQLARTVAAMDAIWTSDATKINGTIRAWLRDWIEELLCDQLALVATGPAFLWAFVGFVVPLGYGEPGFVHPPNTVRVRLALETLDELGWRPWMDGVAPNVMAWLRRVSEDAVGAIFSPLAFIRDQLLRRSDLSRDVAIERSGTEVLSPTMAVPGATAAFELLQRQILPVGMAEPLAARAILLGGWQEAFRRHGDSPSGVVSALKDDNLQDLIGKAIEMATVWASWKAFS